MRSIDMKNLFKRIFGDWRTTTATLLMLVLIVMIAGCGGGIMDHTKVATIHPSNPALPVMDLSAAEVAGLMQEFSRLSNSEYTYEYNRTQVISFPLKPDHFAYFLEVSAEVVGHDSKLVFSSYKLYVELTQNQANLYFNPDNFQQACSSTTCDDCRLILYQNGGFGCDCSDDSPESTSDCSYEKSRVLTNKQQKSDII